MVVAACDGRLIAEGGMEPLVIAEVGEVVEDFVLLSFDWQRCS